MRLFSRQDTLLVVGLAGAAVIAFSTPLSHLLDYTREVERESGLALLPALILLTGVYVVHQLRKRHEIQAQAFAAEAAKKEAEARSLELERLVAFGHSLARALDHEAIRASIHMHLPAIAGTDRIWVLLRMDTRWEALAGDTRGVEGFVENEQFAERLLGGVKGFLPPTDTIGIPLIAGGTPMGVLGIKPEDGNIASPQRLRALEAAAALLAVSLKNAQLFREVRENSLRDPLTGCSTRVHASEVVDGELRRARRSQMPISLILFDLDHFKEVNDRYGHLCGDAVLASIGKRMREVLRGSDLKCRFGGEEFLVLLPETPLHGARRVAESLRAEIADHPVAWGGDELAITASFGVAQAMPGEINMQGVIGRADAALYRAKEDGRNCVRVASDALSLVPDHQTSVVG